MEYARETAEPLARALNLPVQISEALNEVDFGEWQGAEVVLLSEDERFLKLAAFQAGYQIPGGETMISIQARVVNEMIRLKNKFPNEQIAFITHGHLIRAALCYWMGMPLGFRRLTISHGSFSIVSVGDDGAQIQAMNVL